MNVGIKYCGGCNPRYERKSIVERLKKEHKELTVSLAKEHEIYDLVIILCGCSSCCVNHENINGKRGKVILSSENDYKKIINII